MGNSINYDQDKVIIKKGKFTSCKDNNDCPPWSIASKEIIHDKKKMKYITKMLGLIYTTSQFFIFQNFFIQTQLLIDVQVF